MKICVFSDAPFYVLVVFSFFFGLLLDFFGALYFNLVLNKIKCITKILYDLQVILNQAHSYLFNKLLFNNDLVCCRNFLSPPIACFMVITKMNLVKGTKFSLMLIRMEDSSESLKVF